jgi:hypothetical protein
MLSSNQIAGLSAAFLGASLLCVGPVSAKPERPNALDFSYTVWAQSLILSGSGIQTAHTKYGEIACSTISSKRTCSWRDGNKTSR